MKWLKKLLGAAQGKGGSGLGGGLRNQSAVWLVGFVSLKNPGNGAKSHEEVFTAQVKSGSGLRSWLCRILGRYCDCRCPFLLGVQVIAQFA